MITVNLHINPIYRIGDVVYMDSYDAIKKVTITGYLIKTYLIEGKSQLDYAYQVKTTDGKLTTVDGINLYLSKEKAKKGLLKRRFGKYVGKSLEEIAILIQSEWKRDSLQNAKAMLNSINEIKVIE